MALDVVQFVDSIAASPTVRLDLNTENPWALSYDGTDFSPPRLRRAVAQTLMRDGATYPASAYDDRVLKLRLELQTSTVDGQASALQALAREVDRPFNFLKWQPVGATNPVFFRTVRSDLARVTEYPGAGTFRVVDVELLAEPFAYGIKETLAQVTVTNDPAAGSNGMFFDVASPKGDVETPLFMQIAAGDVVKNDGQRRTSVFGVRRRGTPANVPFAVQAESMTMSTDTTVQPNDGTMSGAGSNFIRCTFTINANLAERASKIHPAAASQDVRGVYRGFLRGRKSVAGDPVTVRLASNAGGAVYLGDTVTWPAINGLVWVDVGLIQFPPGADPAVDGYSGVPLQTLGHQIAIHAGRTSGTTTLDLDVLVFVPADDRLCLVKWPLNTGSSANFIIDGANPSVYSVDAGGAVAPTYIPELAGGTPLVSPGVTNRVFTVPNANSTGVAPNDDSKGLTYRITPYYWPRYLHVKPVSS